MVEKKLYIIHCIYLLDVSRRSMHIEYTIHASELDQIFIIITTLLKVYREDYLTDTLKLYVKQIFYTKNRRTIV